MEDKELEAIRERKTRELKAAARPPEIIVYWTPDCRYCAMAKTFFKEKGIAFTDYDVSADKERAREMVMKTGQGAVPVIQINGRLMIGFDRRLMRMR